MAITVRPWSTAASERSRWRAARGSISEVASSRTSVCGSASTSRASATCWAWAAVSARPPEPTTVSSPSGSARPTRGRRRPPARADVVVGGARRRGQREVLAQGADEDVVLLGHQRDVAAQLVQRQLDQPDAADGHRAGAGRVDAGEQPAQRRLAGAGRADHRDPLADADVEVDAVQHVAALDVGEPDVAGVELLAVRLGAGDLAVVGHLRDAEQPGQRGAADLQLVEDRDDRSTGSMSICT